MNEKIENFDELTDYQKQVLMGRYEIMFTEIYETQLAPLEKELEQGLRDKPIAFYASINDSGYISDDERDRLLSLFRIRDLCKQLVDTDPSNTENVKLLAQKEQDIFDYALELGKKMMYKEFWDSFNSEMERLAELERHGKELEGDYNG